MMKTESSDIEYDRVSLISDIDDENNSSKAPWNNMNMSFDTTDKITKERNKEMMHRVLYHVTMICISMAGLAIIFLMSDKVMKPSKIPASIFKTEDSTIYTLYRDGYEPLEYFTDSSVASYKFLDDYDAIIEPRVDNYLYVSSFSDKTDTSYKFTICKKEDIDKCSHGTLSNGEDGTSPVHASCSPYDEYVLTISVYDEDGELEKSYVKSALCMYVRRELRSLTSSDLEDTMDAMHTLWKVDDDDGQKNYGDDYHSSTYFVEAHHFNAAWQDGEFP